MRKLAVMVLGLLVGMNITGCSSPRELNLHVPAGPVAFDSPLNLTVDGARPGHAVQVTAAAVDATGARWTAHADLTADRRGRVDAASAAPTRGGSYTGAHGTGLLWSMQADGAQLQFRLPEDATLTVTFTATQRGATGTKAVQRRWFRAPGVRKAVFTQDDAGFVGTLYTPPAATARRTAVLVLGGSEGGQPVYLPEALASQGYPALSMAYFKAPGLPSELAGIPLEYFATALRRLAKEPGVDPRRIAVIGASRGSEAALQLGVDYPALVDRVAGLSASSVVNAGYPDYSRPAWTWHGKPVPHTEITDYGRTAPTRRRAVIPVERIRGPVLLLYGSDDQLWPSGNYAATMAARLARHRHPVTDLAEPGAGHLIAFPVPNLLEASNVLSEGTRTENVGGTVEADSLGRLDAWPKLLAFLGN